jgi:hypothetical protein
VNIPLLYTPSHSVPAPPPLSTTFPLPLLHVAAMSDWEARREAHQNAILLYISNSSLGFRFRLPSVSASVFARLLVPGREAEVYHYEEALMLGRRLVERCTRRIMLRLLKGRPEPRGLWKV